MSTDRRGRLEVPGGCLLTGEVGWGTWWTSTDRRGKFEVPGGCLLAEEVGWGYLVDVY